MAKTGRFEWRTEQARLDRLTARAEERRVSRNALIERAVDEWLNHLDVAVEEEYIDAEIAKLLGGSR